MMYGPKFQPFLTCFLQTMVRHSHYLAAKHLRSRFWLYIVEHSHLFLPAFCKLWSDIHTFLQPNTSDPTFDDVCSEIPTFSYPLFANYGQTFTPSFISLTVHSKWHLYSATSVLVSVHLVWAYAMFQEEIHESLCTWGPWTFFCLFVFWFFLNVLVKNIYRTFEMCETADTMKCGLH